MKLEFSGPLWYWKGPAPWYFVTVPEERKCHDLKTASRFVTYGWGMIPVRVTDRPDRVEDLAVSQGRAVPGADPGERTEDRADSGRAIP